MSYWAYNTEGLVSKNYICGHCGSDITSNRGYFTTDEIHNSPNNEGYIYICHKCNKPTYFSTYEQLQVPGCLCGKEFNDSVFPDENTKILYNEIRNCMSAHAYTSAVLSARKLLMHIGVNCGAEEGKTFEYYVNYLDEKGYVSINCKKWIDIIRKKGNEANHEIQIFSEQDAKQIIKFIEIMISVIYEMPKEADLFESEQ